MKTQLIVIISLMILPISVVFADFKQPDTILINNDGSTTVEPMDDGMSPTIRNTRDHIDKTMNETRERMNQFNEDGTRKTPNNVPFNQPPNEVPIKQPSDVITHPSTTY